MKNNTPPAQQFTGSWQQLRTSATLLRANIEPVIVISLLPSLVAQLGSLLVAKGSNAGSFIAIIGGIWLLISMPAAIYMELRAVKRQSVVTLDAYVKGLSYFWRVLGVTILSGLLVLLGLICFIVPGLMLMRRYVLAPYYIVDKDMAVIAAMKQSWTDSQQAPWYIWGTIGVLICVSVLAAVVGQIFKFIPGGDTIVTSILSTPAVFMFALRYIEIARPTHKD